MDVLAPVLENLTGLALVAVAVLWLVITLRRDVAGGLAERVRALEEGPRRWVGRVHQLETAMIAAGVPVPPWPEVIPPPTASKETPS